MQVSSLRKQNAQTQKGATNPNILSQLVQAQLVITTEDGSPDRERFKDKWEIWASESRTPTMYMMMMYHGEMVKWKWN